MVRSPEGLNEADCVSVKKPFPVPHRLVPSSPSRGIQEVARQAVTSPIRLSRLEVAVPFRVLLSIGVAGLLGYLLPVWSWRSLNARAFPVFLPLLLLKEATP
jgi:hypothetical protein